MKYKKLHKKKIHINFLKLNKTNINLTRSNLLIMVYLISQLFNVYIHKTYVKINYMMVNKDFRLLWRESSLLLSFLLKIKTIQPSNNYIYNEFLLNKNLKCIRKLKYLNLVQKLNVPLQTLLLHNLIPSYKNFLNNKYKKRKHSQPNYFKEMLININNFQVKALRPNKNFSIIRSPFVYSKSKESFGSCNYRLLITLQNFPNIFISLYFSKIQCYYNKHNFPLLRKCLK
jgi:hypothetical protein